MRWLQYASNVTLQVGVQNRAVTVAELIPTVETTNSEVSQIMDENVTTKIPLNARDLQQWSFSPGFQQTYTSSFGRQASVGGRPRGRGMVPNS